MRCRILLVILSYLWMPLAPFPEGRAWSGQQGNLSRDQAFAALRSKSSKPNSSFQIVREFTSTNEMQDFAQRAAEEASSRHVSVSEDGIFLALLRTGGFLILETDPATGSAISLNLISGGMGGIAIIESHQVEGNVSAVVATELLKNTADFVDALLATPLSEVSGLENRFDGSHFPEDNNSDERSLFALPRAIREMKVDENETRELAALFGGINFWAIRYALSMPMYTANPYRAFRLAVEKQEALFAKFAQENNKGPDFIHDFEDLKSVQTPAQLRERISWFRRLDNFLEDAFQAENISSTFKINKSLSTVALFLGSTTTAGEVSFSVMTASGPGLIVEWKRLPTGSLAVSRIGFGE